MIYRAAFIDRQVYRQTHQPYALIWKKDAQSITRTFRKDLWTRRDPPGLAGRGVRLAAHVAVDMGHAPALRRDPRSPAIGGIGHLGDGSVT